MRNYKHEQAAHNWQTIQMDQDISRQHATNYGIGIALITFCIYVLCWSILKMFWEDLPNITIVLCLPISLGMGISWGSAKLLEFTEEHRNWLYAIEEQTGIDINGDGIVGDPPIFDRPTLLMGIDGIRHRLNTELLPSEIERVKQLLLLSGKATVRSLTAIVGDRASQLREELIALNICDRPLRNNAAALVSERGKRALMRW